MVLNAIKASKARQKATMERSSVFRRPCSRKWWDTIQLLVVGRLLLPDVCQAVISGISLHVLQGRKVDGSVNAYAINVSQKRKYRWAFVSTCTILS